MKTISKLLFIALCVAAVWSCEDIMEEDITNDQVITVAPTDNQEVHGNVVTFRWNELKGADDYRLQVYSEGQNIVLDSLVHTNNFTYSVIPGTYQWRVRGENFAYQTAYTFPLHFTLFESDDLTSQQVPLVAPSSGIYTNNTAQVFTWTGINAAQYYDFQLINVSAGNTVAHQQTEIEETSYALSSAIISQDGQYMWKVKAINPDNDTETQYASRTFYVDRTAPNQPLNSLPANNSTDNTGNEINFEWNAATDSGPINSPVNYSFQIATDTGFNSVVQSVTTATASYAYIFTNTGIYYWRVKSNDQAGNQSGYSSYYKITVQ